jgi:hypothetical protein
MQETSITTTQRYINDSYRDEITNDYRGFVQRVRGGIETEGIAVLKDFIHPDFLAELRASVDQLTPLCYRGDKRKYLSGPELKDTPFHEVTFSDFLIQLSNDILGPYQVHVEAADIHPVLNILVGEKGQDSVRGWHFDATYLTIAMPVVMPPPGERDGKFRIWPNVRGFSQNKLLDKFYWKLANQSFFQRMARNFAINFVPGNLYFFYGFRSYHGTDPLDATQLRANCLMNYGGPFFDLEKGKVMRYAK